MIRPGPASASVVFMATTPKGFVSLTYGAIGADLELVSLSFITDGQNQAAVKLEKAGVTYSGVLACDMILRDYLDLEDWPAFAQGLPERYRNDSDQLALFE